jgi:hypothetical protein
MWPECYKHVTFDSAGTEEESLPTQSVPIQMSTAGILPQIRALYWTACVCRCLVPLWRTIIFEKLTFAQLDKELPSHC